ncbi:Cullin-1 [Bienertia sinuspersici]
MSEMANKINLKEGLKILDEAFSKTRMIMEGHDIKFSAEEYLKFYEYPICPLCVYQLCAQRTSFENSSILYERYKYGLEECIHSLVLPSLEDKNDASLLLTELLAKWSSYQKMVKWLSRFLCYLDRYYIPRVGALGLLELAFRCFHNLVNAKFNAKLIPAAMSLINQDRDGEKIDRNLLKNVVDYFYTVKSLIEVECTCYDDFEKALFTYSSAYYSQVASHGLLHYSYADYMHKVEWCLKQECERASHFFNLPLRQKLMQVVKSCLVDHVLTKLAEKHAVECYGNYTDYQDLLSKCAELNLQDPGPDRNWNMVQQP